MAVKSSNQFKLSLYDTQMFLIMLRKFMSAVDNFK